MGLVNTLFNELERIVIELDESEGTLSSNYEDITKELKDLKERKANNSRVHVNYSLDSMIILNVLRRLQALKEGKPRMISDDFRCSDQVQTRFRLGSE